MVERGGVWMVVVVMCGLAGSALGQAGQAAASSGNKAGAVSAGAALDWDQAFVDRSAARPVHFVAAYLDGQGRTHRLEEWRAGVTHLRRRTDAHIDLHADAVSAPRPGQPVDYVWQILDLDKKIEHRVSTQGMLRAGMFYSYYSMAHVLSRPAGQFAVHAVRGLAPVALEGAAGEWFEISAAGQPATRVCWLAALGVPLRTMTETKDGWKTNFEIQTSDTRPIAPAVFAVDAKGFQVRNVDEIESED